MGHTADHVGAEKVGPKHLLATWNKTMGKIHRGSSRNFIVIGVLHRAQPGANMRSPNGHRVHVASLAQAGRIEEARTALAPLRELHPESSIARIERNAPCTAPPMAKFLEGLCQAGLH
jgi:hypothetical protein